MARQGDQESGSHMLGSRFRAQAADQTDLFPSLGLSLFICSQKRGGWTVILMIYKVPYSSDIWLHSSSSAKGGFQSPFSWCHPKPGRASSVSFCSSLPLRLTPTDGESYPAAGSLIQLPCGKFCYACFTVGHVKSTCIS